MNTRAFQTANGADSARSFDAICSLLATRLRARIPELETGLANLVDGVADVRDVGGEVADGPGEGAAARAEGEQAGQSAQGG